jgi:hypothetical protein
MVLRYDSQGGCSGTIIKGGAHVRNSRIGLRYDCLGWGSGTIFKDGVHVR